MNRECGITTTDEVWAPFNYHELHSSSTFPGQSEIPERWRAAALSKVEMPSEDQVCLLL